MNRDELQLTIEKFELTNESLLVITFPGDLPPNDIQLQINITQSIIKGVNSDVQVLYINDNLGICLVPDGMMKKLGWIRDPARNLQSTSESNESSE